MIKVSPNAVIDDAGRYFLEYPCQNEDCYPYTVELKRGLYLIECWGASGSEDENQFVRGAYVSGILVARAPQTLYAYIGSVGKLNGPKTFNGGGKGSKQGYSGGGATDFRTKNGKYDELNGLLSRIIVAAGAGGLNQYTEGSYISEVFVGTGSGGAEKGLNGYVTQATENIDSPLTQAMGGTQQEGGMSGYCPSNCLYGCSDQLQAKLGIGQDCCHSEWGTGGGGGYFGGGAGSVNHYIVGSGAGGSSYVSGHSNCTSVVGDDSVKGYYVNYDTSVHQSTLYFLRATMLSGDDPLIEPNGKSAKGHTGSGAARITFIGFLDTQHFNIYLKLWFTFSSMLHSTNK